MTSSACPNCSPRLPNEAAHTLNRVLLLRPRPVPSITKPVHHWNADHPEARTRQNRHFFSTLLIAYVPWHYDQTRQAVPPIHDITTDTDNPPAFVAVVPLRQGEGVNPIA